MHRQTLVLWVVGTTLLLGVAAQASEGDSSAAIPSREQGVFAALDDPSNEVVARTLELLLTEAKEKPMSPAVHRRLQAFIRAPRMSALLRDGDESIRRPAVSTLSKAGGGTKEHATILIEFLKDAGVGGRAEAVRALGAMGEAAKEHVPIFLSLLKDADPAVRAEAVRALGSRVEEAKAHASLLVSHLKDSNWIVRAAVVETLGTMGEAAKDQVPLVASFLSDADAGVRVAATRALGAIGKVAKDKAPLLVPLLKDSDSVVRATAAQALGAIGMETKDQESFLVPLLQDPDGNVRVAAARALGALGMAARVHAPLLFPLLKDPDGSVRAESVQALGAMGMADRVQASLLVPLLGDPEARVRATATQVLGSMGEAANDQASRLASLLKDPNEVVRATAVEALGSMGDAAKKQVPLLALFLEDDDAGVRVAAIEVLGAMGKEAKEPSAHFVPLLKDPDWSVRVAAAKGLGAMGMTTKDQASLLGPLLKDSTGRDSGAELRAAAAQALGFMGEAAKEQAPLLVPLLKDSHAYVREAAVNALGTMGQAAKEQAPLLVPLLKDPTSDVRKAALEALLGMVPLEGVSVAGVLAQAIDDEGQRATWLLRTHIVGGGDASVERVLQWVGRPPEETPQRLTLEEARATLRAFAEFWPHTEHYRPLRKELAEQIATVARLNRGQWESEDVELLESHVKRLHPFHPMLADTVLAAIDHVERWRRLTTFGWGWAGHVGFWVLLLFFYPRSPKVQAFFFWNPWVRNITGLGYVGLLLTWVPFLRRRLMVPFRRQLLADADLERFSTELYFDRSDVLTPSSTKPERLLSALPRLQGQVTLEGASGLGKSMFLRHLLRQSKRLAVYLPAERCKDGVIEAIQAKLEGQAKDPGFLQSIIYSGALDIYIDGLNEVTADTRARIVQFVERNTHGNILLSTQRIEWTPPKTARLYVLQPLSEDAISEFLVSREPTLGEKSKLRGDAYRQACERFVKESLTPEQPEKVRLAMREVLSNPMDLTVVAQMLADGHLPELSHLRQQQYELMARDYAEVHLAEFPLKEFAEEAYRMRREDRTTLAEERFARELLRMEDFKMVLRRQWKGPDDKERREWRFRHDKIQEFFIAQTFLGDQNLRVIEHMGDPRFRGVYFLLAFMLPMEKARQLRDLLVEHAAETRDNTLVNDFVLLLKSREGAEKARATGMPQAAVTPIRQSN